VTVRVGVAAVSLLVFGVWLAEGLLGLPGVSDPPVAYARRLAELALTERAAANAVSAVLFDLRAFDTLGEALALFAGTAAVQVVLREVDTEAREAARAGALPGRRPAATSDAVRGVCLVLVAPALLYGVLVATRGHVSVGGGFQGGAIVGASLTLLYLAGRGATARELVSEQGLDVAESVGVGALLVLGTVALVAGAGFLGNVLPTGTAGRLASAGTIGVVSVLIGLEATGGVATFVRRFDERTVALGREGT
jgi:multicomponent Na+:H+ antiporter subunit B